MLLMTSYSAKLLNKGNYGSQIKLVENDELLQSVNYFKNAVSTLNISKTIFIINRTSDDLTDPVEKAIEKCK